MRLTLVLALSMLGAPALAANGLVASPDAFSARWGARIEIDTQPLLQGSWNGQPLGQASVVQMTRLFGDYHLDTLKFGQTSGLRLTGGVLLNNRQPNTLDDARGNWPYVGLGYAGYGLRGDWRFSADVGIAAQNPGAVGRIGRGDLADTLREMRLQPVIRFGVSYNF